MADKGALGSDAAASDVIDGALATPAGCMLIGGQWVAAADGAVIACHNPATGALLGHVPAASAQDVDRAVAAARAAFRGQWSRFTPFERQALLLKVADLVDQHWEALCQADTADMGLPISRTLGNRRRVLGMLRHYAGIATTIGGQTIPNSFPGSILSFTTKEPVGVVGAIIPWNAPTASSIWKIGPALATGCTIVLKPSEEASIVPLMLGKLMLEAGVPDGVVNIVTGNGAAAGAALAAHPDVDKIVFTGSTATGQAIIRASAGNVKRVSLELGGKSPLIIFPDADLAKAVPTAAMAVFAHSGQICIAGSRLFVHKAIAAEFQAELVRYSQGLRIGDGLDPTTDLGPVISRRQLDRINGFVKRALADGAQLATGGAVLDAGALANGNFIAPTVFTSVADTMEIARSEVFGPVISMLEFTDEDDVLTRANATPYGLAAGLFTRDLARAHRLAAQINAGSVYVNGYHMIDPAVPFGGYKMSGYGREGGMEQIEGYLNTKATWFDLN